MIKRQSGFTILEVLVAMGILSLVLVLIGSFLFQLNYANSRTKAQRESLENARRALDAITYEIKAAKSVYTPTTTENQLSLETARYATSDETFTFIDFFLCGAGICLKKEGQAPSLITADTVQVTALSFTQVVNGSRPSLQVQLTAIAGDSSVTLTSTVALRSY